MLTLRTSTSEAWTQAVLADFDTFLLDHAACERKASAMAISFVVRYPDRDAILEPLIQLAREELTHFHRVFKILQARGLHFTSDSKDPYLNALLPRIQGGREAEFVDRMLMAGVVEARGCERFGVLAQALEDPELQAFYTELAESESRHASLFTDLVGEYLPREQLEERVEVWLDWEAEAIASIPPRAALH